MFEAVKKDVKYTRWGNGNRSSVGTKGK